MNDQACLSCSGTVTNEEALWGSTDSCVPLREKPLSFCAWANKRETLGRVVTAEDANNVAMVVVHRAARKAVEGVHLDRPVLSTLEYVWSLKDSFAQELGLVRLSDEDKLLVDGGV